MILIKFFLQDSNGDTENRGQTYRHVRRKGRRAGCMETVAWRHTLPHMT